MAKRILYIFLSFILLGVFSMAIILPSMHIYTTNNPKVRDNVVDNVSVETSSPSVIFEMAKSFATTVSLTENAFAEDGFAEDNFGLASATQPKWTAYCEYMSMRAFYTSQRIGIARKQKNTAITKLYSKQDENGNNNITYSVVYKTYKGTATATIANIANAGGGTYEVGIKNLVTQYGEPEKDLVSGIISLSDSYTYENLRTLSINIVDDKTNNGTLEPIKLGDIEYVLPLYLLVGKETIKLGGDSGATLEDPFGEFQTTYGYCEKLVPVQIDVHYKGDTITLTFDESSNLVGSGNNPFLLARNELRQNTNTILGENADIYLANRVISEYQNGKETATVLVSVSEYYDENGELVISTKRNDLPMTFRIGDLVIPMVYGVDGVDRPMSRYKDGSPKIFRVVGRKPYFDGAVWQELSLQEFDKANLS